MPSARSFDKVLRSFWGRSRDINSKMNPNSFGLERERSPSSLRMLPCHRQPRFIPLTFTQQRSVFTSIQNASFPFVLCASLVLSVDSAPPDSIQWYLRHASQTQLLGSHFGIPSIDQTFDYVVRRPVSITAMYRNNLEPRSSEGS